MFCIHILFVIMFYRQFDEYNINEMWMKFKVKYLISSMLHCIELNWMKNKKAVSFRCYLNVFFHPNLPNWVRAPQTFEFDNGSAFSVWYIYDSYAIIEIVKYTNPFIYWTLFQILCLKYAKVPNMYILNKEFFYAIYLRAPKMTSTVYLFV